MAAAPSFPLRVFYDGSCPLCSQEIEHYRRRDRRGWIVPVDISVSDFDPAPFDIPLASFMYELHAIDRRGEVYRGVDAFRAIWQAFPDAGLYRALAAIVALPVVNSLARLGYRGFARMRPYLPGRRAACAAGHCRIGGDGGADLRGEGR